VRKVIANADAPNRRYGRGSVPAAEKSEVSARIIILDQQEARNWKQVVLCAVLYKGTKGSESTPSSLLAAGRRGRGWSFIE
jgi:hypothetical protein